MGELSIMLDPNEARVCMLEDDVPDLAGIAGVGDRELEDCRRHVKGVVGSRRAKESPKQSSASRARYPRTPVST